MAFPELEIGAAVSVVGLAIVQSMSMYRDAAPSLKELRNAPVADYNMRQQILDADIYGGIAVAVIGGSVGVLTRSLLPILLGSIGLILLSVWSRMVLNSPSPDRGTETNEGSTQ